MTENVGYVQEISYNFTGVSAQAMQILEIMICYHKWQLNEK